LLHADSLTALLKAQGAAGKAIVLGTSDVQLTPLGPDAVVWSGIVSGVVKDSAGAERAVRGALTLVLRRHGAGEWAIAAGHESVRPFDDTHEAAAAAAPR
jgi:ketosteroid isomerase-like protein